MNINLENTSILIEMLESSDSGDDSEMEEHEIELMAIQSAMAERQYDPKIKNYVVDQVEQYTEKKVCCDKTTIIDIY